jgi:chemosensory pili system protein ChpC
VSEVEPGFPIALPAFLIPLQKSNLLLPNAAVAEIIPYEPLQRVQDTPDWFLGFLAWRGIQVPIASFEMLTVKRASFSLVSVASANLVILRALGGADDFSYFAVVAQTLPRLERVGPDQLFETDEPVAKTELVKVRFGNDLVSIPDLDFIESEIRAVAFQ